MAKALWYGDIHARDTKIKRRKDPDILETILDKLRCGAERCKELGVEVCILGGDIGHYPDWTLWMAKKVAKVFKSFPCTVVTVIGNHDVDGRSYETYKNSGVGYLEDVGAVQILDPYAPFATSHFRIYGFHSDTEECTKLIKGEWKPIIHDNKKLNIAVAHAPIGPFATPHSIDHKTLEVVGFDILLVADIHDPFPPYKLPSGTVVANSGTISRQKINEKDIIPSVFIIDSDGTITKETIPHKSIEEVFRGLDIVEYKSGKGFVDAANAAIKAKDISPQVLVETTGKEFKFSKKSINRLLKELSEKK